MQQLRNKHERRMKSVICLPLLFSSDAEQQWIFFEIRKLVHVTIKGLKASCDMGALKTARLIIQKRGIRWKQT